MIDITEGLNDAQKEAVLSDGPLLVLAGAGSGKTKTLTHRIGHIIQQGFFPNEILAVTFTNKAAKEMRERLANLLTVRNSYSFMPWMGTFHGICVKLLRIDGWAIGIDDNFVIYDDADKIGLIKQVIKELNISDIQVKPRLASSKISSAKNDLMSPEDYETSITLPHEKVVADIFRLYEKKRQKANALDFDDLLVEVVRLFRDSPEVRRKWQKHFKHILIDEYQDTNPAQYQIVKFIIGDSKNICVVGDDWQSIYSWRGADYKIILNFEKDFEGTNVIKLEQNYRSTSNILDVAHKVISKNKVRTDKKLWTKTEGGAPVLIHRCPTEAEEGRLVASKIREYVNSGKYSLADVAILYRTNAQSYALEKSMREARLDYKIVGGIRFYDRKEIKDILAFLKLAYQPRDIMSFTRVVNIPTRGIGDTSLAKFLDWYTTSDWDIVGSLINADQCHTVQKRAQNSFMLFGEKIRQIQTAVKSEAAPNEVVEKTIDIMDYRSYILDGSLQAEDREMNISALISDAKNYQTISEFLEQVALMSSVDDEVGDNQVKLMTFHAAKGLEFPVVFMTGMEDGVFPHSRTFDSDSDMEEERRLCYVGMTRACKELHLSHSESRMQYGNIAYSTASRFLNHIDGTEEMKFDDDIDSAVDDFFSQEVEYPKVDLDMRVKSPSFGKGTVVGVDGTVVEIVFDDGQRRRLDLEFASLSPV